MPDELDDRIRNALLADVAELALAITPAMIEDRLERGIHRSWIVTVAGTAALASVFAGLLVALGLLLDNLSVGPPTNPTPTASPLGGGDDLVWQELPVEGAERVVFDNDRFVLLPATTSGTLTSLDGLQWEEAPGAAIDAGVGTGTWDGTVLSWADRLLQIRRPDGSIVARSFDAPISAAAIGPTGMVVLASSPVDETVIVEEVLGRDWSDRIVRTCMCAVGTLTVTRDDGQSADIVLADHGYVGMRDPQWRGGWFSTTGDQWTPILEPDGETGRLDVRRAVGTDAGFIAHSGDALWHSADGREWRIVETMAVDDLVSWHRGAVAVDYESARYVYWSLDAGVQTLGTDFGADFDRFEEPVTAAGSLGLVTVDRGTERVLFSPDGRTWSVSRLPASRDWSTGFAAWGATSVAVGNDAVVMLLWEWGADGREIASLWRGTLNE